VNFNNIEKDAGRLWYAKTAGKPSFTINAAEHKYLNHTFYYPGNVTWNEVTIALVDPVDPDVSATIADIIVKGGYSIPANPSTNQVTISKAKAASSLGTVTVSQLDSEGLELEVWTLYNAWISDVKFGDLEYGADDLTQVDLTLKYDWAQLETSGTEGSEHAGGGRETDFFTVR
jgi:hypothetical protein